MSPADLADPATVDAVRAILLDELQEYADRCGYLRAQTREHTTVDGLTLTGMMSPRTDGQWPEIHAAILQDRDDREALRLRTDPS